MKRMIKVCGMREPLNIQAVEALQIDMMGFIFYPESQRYVSERPLYLPTHCSRVGVMVNATMDEILTRQHEFALNAIQLHGAETPAFCRELRKELPTGVLMLKAISIAESGDLARAMPYEGLADYLLFDTQCKGHGGSGQQFDWKLLAAYQGSTPFFLSGGIGREDAARICSFHHPRCVGIDLNSRFESAPAVKDVELLKSFLNEIR